MFFDFDNAFNEKPGNSIKIPDALIAYLSKDLPDGLKYVTDSKGYCFISSESKKVTLSGFNFKLTESQKENLGNKFTPKDVLKYFYNSQKPIPLTLDKEGFITVNGKEIAIEKLTYNPYNPIAYVSGTLFAKPSEFPPPFTVTVGNNEYCRDLVISRIPYESLHTIAFGSKNDSSLQIKLFLNELTQDMTLTISIELIYANTVHEIVESISIYNSYLDGKGFLCGYPMEWNLNDNTQIKFDENSLLFWKKVLSLEECLGVEFTPPKKDIDFYTMCIVEQLYQNLVNEVPIRTSEKIDSLSGKGKIKDGNSIYDSIGKPLFCEFESNLSFNLFGKELKLPSMVCIFNAVLSNIKNEDKEYTLSFSNESLEKETYMVVMCFKTQDLLNEYKKNHDKLISNFKKAKKASEYII